MTFLPRLLLTLLIWGLAGVAFAEPTPDERFAQAQQLMREGDYPAALEMLESLTRDHPENVDYLFASGLTLARLNRPGEALENLAVATRLAPDYEDVWRTHHDLLVRQREAEELDNFRRVAARRFPDAAWWQAPDPPPRWWLTVGAGIDSLDNDQPNWDNQFVELRYDVDERQRYALGVARDSRNDASDLSMSISGAWSMDNWFAGAALAAAEDPDIMSEVGVDVHGGRSFDGGWVGTVRYRYRGYVNATVSSTILTTEKYIGNFRFAYDLGLSRLHGASRFTNHVLTGNWFYREGASLGLSFSTGREAEAIGGGQVLETDVESISLNGRHPINERWRLDWWVGLHDQGELYRRKFFGLAVSIGI